MNYRHHVAVVDKATGNLIDIFPVSSPLWHSMSAREAAKKYSDILGGSNRHVRLYAYRASKGLPV